MIEENLTQRDVETSAIATATFPLNHLIHAREMYDKRKESQVYSDREYSPKSREERKVPNERG